MIYLKYLFGVILALPLFPLLYLQGKRVKSSIPDLPEAKGPTGEIKGSSPTFNLIVMGESTMAGVGVETHEEGFAGTLGQALAERLNVGVNWKVYAKSGFTAYDMQQKLVPEIIENEVDMIVIGAGANDTFQLNTPWKWRSDVRKLVNGLRAKFEHIPIVFINMPPVKSFPAFTPLMQFFMGNLVQIQGDVLASEIGRDQNVYFYSREITLEDWIERLNIQAAPKDFFSDGVHPSKLTYQTWAKDLAAFLMEMKILTSVFDTEEITPVHD